MWLPSCRPQPRACSHATPRPASWRWVGSRGRGGIVRQGASCRQGRAWRGCGSAKEAGWAPVFKAVKALFLPPLLAIAAGDENTSQPELKHVC